MSQNCIQTVYVFGVGDRGESSFEDAAQINCEELRN